MNNCVFACLLADFVWLVARVICLPFDAFVIDLIYLPIPFVFGWLTGNK